MTHQDILDARDAAREVRRVAVERAYEVERNSNLSLQPKCGQIGHFFTRGHITGLEENKDRYCMFCFMREPKATSLQAVGNGVKN